MIKISALLTNPFYKDDDCYQKNFFVYDKKLSTNKSFETQLSYFGLDTLFEFDIEIIFSGADHAGPNLTFIIFGLFFSIQIYDHRHWDHDNNTWQD